MNFSSSFPMNMVPESVKIGLNFRKKSPQAPQTSQYIPLEDDHINVSPTDPQLNKVPVSPNKVPVVPVSPKLSTAIPLTTAQRQIFDSFVKRELPPLVDDESDLDVDSDDDLPPLLEDDTIIQYPKSGPGSGSVILGSFDNFEPMTTPEDEMYLNAYKNEFGMDNIMDAMKYYGKNNAPRRIPVPMPMPIPMPMPRPLVNNLSEHPIFFTPDGFIETDISISGKKAKEIFDGVALVKLTNASCVHNGLKLVEGYNVDKNVFDYAQMCGPDGLYFCQLDDILEWLDYGHEPMVYMWDVELPDDAKVVMYDTKLKADKFILSNKRPISDWIVTKIASMIASNAKSIEILHFINGLTNEVKPSAEKMEEIYMHLIINDPSIVRNLSDKAFTYNVCLCAAQNYAGAYEYVSQYCLSHEIVFECVKMDNEIYETLPDSLKSIEMSQYMFRQDVANYEMIPDQYKTIEMTIRYLTDCSPLGPQRDPEINDYIPKRFHDHHEVIAKMIHNDGLHLKNLNYYEKTDMICRLAVKSNGLALEFVPIPYVDFYMCYDAVYNTVDAYHFVPDEFRNQELKEMMIKKSPKMINCLEIKDITRSMIMSIIFSSDQEILKSLAFHDQHIKDLFATNMYDFIEECEHLYCYVPRDYFAYEHALFMVEINPRAYEIFRTLGPDFTIDCVKYSGLHFKNIPSRSVTCAMLKDLVSVRQSIINELQDRFIFPELYEICIKKHGMKISDVPKQYLTPSIMKLQVEEHIEPEPDTESKSKIPEAPLSPKLQLDPVDPDLDIIQQVPVVLQGIYGQVPVVLINEQINPLPETNEQIEIIPAQYEHKQETVYSPKMSQSQQQFQDDSLIRVTDIN